MKKKKENNTIVCGIRISKELWDKCKEIAKSENVTRNSLVVMLIENYCKGV